MVKSHFYAGENKRDKHDSDNEPLTGPCEHPNIQVLLIKSPTNILRQSGRNRESRRLSRE